MKRNGLKRGFSGLLAVVMTVTMLLGLGIGEAIFARADEPAGADIVWDFEDGKLEPFKLVSGSYGTIISNIPYDHNSAEATPYPRQGDYHLTTLETTTYLTAESTAAAKYGDKVTEMTTPSDAYLCELHSPMFRLDDPEMNFLVGGGPGSNKGTYVALCDVYGNEIITASGVGGENMVRVEWDLTDEELVGQYVFLKIVDGSTGGWGHITFDDFHAVGYIDTDMEILPPPADAIVWSFEDGVIEPFKVKEGTLGEYPVVSWNTDRNTGVPLNKDGNYFLSTLDNDGTEKGYSEGFTATIVSPNFYILDPKVTMKLGGGTQEGLYVAVCRAADDEELATAKLSEIAAYEYDKNGNKTIEETEKFESGHWFTDVTLDLGSNFVSGEEVYIKIVDGAEAGPYGFLTVDQIVAYGDQIPTNLPKPNIPKAEDIPTTYAPIAWSFEDGTVAPFTGTINPAPVGSASYDLNVATNKEASYYVGKEIGKDGTYWLNTWSNQALTQTVTDGVVTAMSKSGAETHVGNLVSPKFVLDPANTAITMQLGGNIESGVYVYDAATGQVVGEAHPAASSWMMKAASVTWKEGFTYEAGQVLYMQIQDNDTQQNPENKGYHFVCVDNIAFSGALVTGGLQQITWGFEDGTVAPFVGTINPTPISDVSYDLNCNPNSASASVAGKEIGKTGTYWLNTYSTDKMVQTIVDGKVTVKTVNGKESYTGELVSPKFVLDPNDTKITAQLGGNVQNGLYVYDANTNEVVGEAHAAVSDWKMKPVEVVWKTGFNYREDQVLYMKLVDSTQASFGFICVDAISFKGGIVTYDYDSFHWSFEDGTMAPFTTSDAYKAPNVCDADYCWNGTGKSMNKDGKYYMSTIGIKGNYNEAVTPTFTSPVFFLNPDKPTVSFKIAGGPDARNYVAICNANNGEILAKISPPNQSGTNHPLVDVSLTVADYVAGTPVVIKIVDGTTSSWAFVHVDDFRFEGMYPEYTYNKVNWSFENGTALPFVSDTINNGGLITHIDVDNNDKKTPINKHGKYFLNTVLNQPDGLGGANESITGEFVSPEFMINPENPIISLKIGGGGVSNYVAVYNANTDKELARITPAETINASAPKDGLGAWPMRDAQIDLTGKFSEGDLLYMKIVDNTTSTWAFISVDDIRGEFAFRELPLLTSVKEIKEATGWTSDRFENIRTVLNDLIDTFGAEYPEGKEFLNAFADAEEEIEAMAEKGIKKNGSEMKLFKEKMDALEYQALTSNPYLTSAPIAVTVHQQYRESHQNTHNMFPSYNGETDPKSSFYPGGEVRVIDFGSEADTVTTILSDADGLYRDLDVSYDANKILLSYRDNRDGTYCVYEYTLNEDKTAVVDTKQLTSLSTADDMEPMYMPSGNIVFTSTRDPKYVMCNAHISANMYRMEPDGANIVKIANSTLFERPTDVMPDGRILYDRWEYNDRDFGSAQGLWTMYEDGTKQDVYYGQNYSTGATIEAKVIPGTQKVMAVISSCHDVSWGALAIIDRSNGYEGRDGVERTWPATAINAIAKKPSQGSIDQFKGLPVKYEDPQPLSDKYFLASRMIENNNRKMGLYLLDVFGNETLIYADDSASWGIFDATVLAPRAKEIASSDRRNYKDEVGTFFVQDVYQGTHMEGVERGTVKTLRIAESLSKEFTRGQTWQGQGAQMPGVNWNSFEVKRVIGEVPVYEDGSAYFEVPQDAFVYFQLLDAEGRMINSMRSGTLVQSGEKTGCVGCHEDRRYAPMTYTGEDTPMALKANVEVVPNPDYVEGSNLPKTIAVNTPDVPQKRVLDFATGEDKLVDWNDPVMFPEYTDLPTMNYLTEVQPIFTKNCLECHGYDKQEADLVLVPDKDMIFNASYISLWIRRSGKTSYNNSIVGALGTGDSRIVKAKGWGSYNSPLVNKIFNDEAHAARLTDAEKRRIAEWVDLNGTYYGDYASNYNYNPAGRSPLNQSERNALGDTRGLSVAGMQYAGNAQVYFDNPEKSPILKGLTVGSEEYNNKLNLIKTGLDRLRMNPDIDWKGLTTVPGNPSLKINPYQHCAMNQWRADKVALYDEMEAANRAAIVAGTKLYDKDHEAVMAAHFAKWPGDSSFSRPGNYYDTLPN